MRLLLSSLASRVAPLAALPIALALAVLTLGPGLAPAFANRVVNKTAGGGGGSSSWLYVAGASAGMAGELSGVTGANTIHREEITVPTGGGKITKIGLRIGSVINANTTFKLAILDASLNQVGTIYSAPLLTSETPGMWRDIVTDIDVSAGQHWIAYSTNAPYEGAITLGYFNVGTVYYDPAGTYAGFYAGGYSWSSAGFSFGLRAELTP